MKINTTITVLKDGVCILETDVTANVSYDIDRGGELDWFVEEYTIEGDQRLWNKDGSSAGVGTVCVVVPDKLAEIFDEYLDRDWMEEQIRERLSDYAADNADWLRDQAMDR